MEFLFVIPHGNYINFDLTCEGIKQGQEIAQEMKKICSELENPSLYVVSSDVPMAKQTAKIIADEFKTSFELYDRSRLWLSDPDDVDPNDLVDCFEGMIEERKNLYSAIALVGHLRVVNDFSRYFLKRVFKSESLKEIGLGEGICFDLESGKFDYIPSS